MASITEQLAERLAAREEGRTREAPPTDEAIEDPTAAAEGETPDEAQTEGETEGTAPSETDQPEEIRSVAEFAKAAGWEPEDLYKLSVKLDNGEEVPLGQVKDKLQELTRSAASVAEQQQRLDEYAAQLQSQAQEYFSARKEEGQEATQAHEAMLAVQARFNSVNWDELEKANPGQAALLQQRMAAEYAGAKQQYAVAQQREIEAARQYAHQARTQHAQQLVKAVPEWQNQEVAKAEIAKMQDYLGQWFRRDELESIFDWRANMLARKAWLYDQGQVKMKEAETKVRAAPKPVMKPGTGAIRGAAAKSHEQSLINKAHETRRIADKNAAASAILRRALGK
jgi:hypothetical protein